MSVAGVEGVITPRPFRHVLGHFPSGVVVLTANPGQGPVGLSCQSFFSLSLEPPLVAVATALTSTSWPLIAAGGEFAVNVLSSHQAGLCASFAVSGADKFSGVSWQPGRRTRAPLLDGALAWLECAIEQTHRAGDHYLTVARVLDADAREGDPLIFLRGRYLDT